MPALDPYRFSFRVLQGETIVLLQYGHGNFAVEYGGRIKNRLTEFQAAAALGHCIFHALRAKGRFKLPEGERYRLNW